MIVTYKIPTIFLPVSHALKMLIFILSFSCFQFPNFNTVSWYFISRFWSCLCWRHSLDDDQATPVAGNFLHGEELIPKELTLFTFLCYLEVMNYHDYFGDFLDNDDYSSGFLCFLHGDFIEPPPLVNCLLTPGVHPHFDISWITNHLSTLGLLRRSS